MASNYDPLDLRGQEQSKADKDLRDKLARENEESDMKWLMSSKRGRRIVWRILDQAGVFRLSFNPNSMQMAFNEGNRNIGLRIIATIHSSCPEQYQAMLKEQNDRIPDDTASPNQ